MAPTPFTLLLTVSLRGRLVEQRAFHGRGCIVGRSGSSDVVLEDPAVSRAHVELSYEDDAYWLNDLGSANGVSLNGHRVQRELLRTGDCIRLGDHELHVSLLLEQSCDSTEAARQLRSGPTLRLPSRPRA
jgi:pSer/pThr/pTyr-binding forkhead associated (FHA) protein